MIKNRTFGVVPLLGWWVGRPIFLDEHSGHITRPNCQPHQYQVYIFLTGPALSGSLVKTFGFGAMLTGCGIVCFLYCPLLLLLRLVSIWSVGWLVGWFYSWSVIQSVGELVGWLIGQSHEG